MFPACSGSLLGKSTCMSTQNIFIILITFNLIIHIHEHFLKILSIRLRILSKCTYLRSNHLIPLLFISHLLRICLRIQLRTLKLNISIKGLLAVEILGGLQRFILLNKSLGSCGSSTRWHSFAKSISIMLIINVADEESWCTGK